MSSASSIGCWTDWPCRRTGREKDFLRESAAFFHVFRTLFPICLPSGWLGRLPARPTLEILHGFCCCYSLVFTFLKLHLMNIVVCVLHCVECHGKHVEVREHLVESASLLPLCGVQGLNSGQSAWQQMPIPTKHCLTNISWFSNGGVYT